MSTVKTFDLLRSALRLKYLGSRSNPFPQHRDSSSKCLQRLFSRSCSSRPGDDAFPLTELLPVQYLRAVDSSNYDVVTGQRTDVAVDLYDGKPLFGNNKSTPAIKSCVLDGDVYHVTWNDGLQSKYNVDWVENTSKRWKQDPSMTEHIYWTGMNEEQIRSSSLLSIEFGDLITDEGMSQGLKSLYQYGILLVTKTPIADDGAGVAALAASLGGGSVKNKTSLLTQYGAGGTEIMLPHGTDGPLRTLYGTVWSTTSSGQADGASIADSAYGHDGLPLHTDMTYMRDPPGLQIFTMKQPARKGGESLFGDGFAAADRLRRTDPDAFEILSNTIRTYRSIDPATGWHLQANGPVINVHNGEITMIRHNDLDRLPDLPPPDEVDVDDFYEKLQNAHEAWDQILAEDDMRLVVGLEPGDTMVVANQRCFHGRMGFEASTSTPRSVMGCYMSQDELNSRFRVEGFIC